MALTEDNGWIESQVFPGQKVVADKCCEACGYLQFRTHNDAIQHVFKHHGIQRRVDNGDLAVVWIAKQPYNTRERTMLVDSVLLFRNVPVMEARWQVESFAKGAAWAVANAVKVGV